MWKIQVQSLGQEDPLEKEMATHSSILAWRIPWTAVRQASLSLTISQSLPKFMSIESMMPSNHFILCYPLLLLPSILLSIRVFSNESDVRIKWPKYWSFIFSIHPSKEFSGLISFKIEHHSLKASILWCSASFIFQLSQPYVATGNTIALTIWTFVNKMSRFVLFSTFGSS